MGLTRATRERRESETEGTSHESVTISDAHENKHCSASGHYRTVFLSPFSWMEDCHSCKAMVKAQASKETLSNMVPMLGTYAKEETHAKGEMHAKEVERAKIETHAKEETHAKMQAYARLIAKPARCIVASRATARNFGS